MIKEVFYDWGGLNVLLFHAINDTESSAFDAAMVFGTLISSYTNFHIYLSAIVLVGIISTYALFSRSGAQADAAASRWLAVAGVFVLSFWVDAAFLTVVKPYLDLPRPPLALGAERVRLLLPAEYHHSFPSGHVFFAATFAASLWPVLSRAGRWIAATYVVWVAISRIKVGAHFPADVLGSCLLSVPIVMLVRLAVLRAQDACLFRRGDGQSTEASTSSSTSTIA